MASKDRPRIKGRVAAILNEREMVINIGLEDGVEVGMRFVVLTDPVTVMDPDTGAPLVSVPLQKVVVKIVKVVRKSAVGRTFRTVPASSGFLAVLGDSRPRIETIQADRDDVLLHQLDADQRLVKVGDKVVEVRGDDEVVLD